jgi:DsbC/DsbD-like thiol-disulfide interchange protein
LSLIAEDNAFAPAHTTWIGVLFDLEKGWHIYWANPGDSGEPPKIQWQLPAGFRAGAIHWSTPVRLGTGTVIDYGYEGRVLLPVPLEVPANYNAAAHAALSADVRYLICREVCIPAKANVTLAVPATNEPPAAAAARREIFHSARAGWPQPVPVGWKVQANDQGPHFVLDLDTGSREMKALFFPLEEDQIDNAAAQTVTPTARGVRITLKKSDQLLKPISTLKGVIVLGNAANGAPAPSAPPPPSRAFEVSVPVTARRATERPEK